METIIQIRPMTKEDLPDVAALEAENFSVPWTERDFAGYLEDPQALFLTAFLLGQTLMSGCKDVHSDSTLSCAESGIISEPISDEEPNRDVNNQRTAGYIGCLFAADEGDITNVSVSPACRRQGIGRTLAETLLRQARARGCSRIFLEVRASNEAAIRLYKGLGFEQIGIRKRYYTKPVEDALLMKWSSSTDRNLTTGVNAFDNN